MELMIKMTLTKVDYNDADETIIHDNNLNEIQDEIILNSTNISTKADNTVVTSTTNGLMSSGDKDKLDGIDAQANKTIVDTSLNSTSTNPVQNKIIKQELDLKQDTLISSGTGQNIKTINGNNLLGTGDITIGGGGYILPTASSTVLGGVKVGTNLDINTNGVLSATDTTYSVATTTTDGLMSKDDKTKLEETMSKNYTSTTLTLNEGKGEIILNKFDGFVIGSLHIVSDNTSMEVGNLPVGYYPKDTIYLNLTNFNASGGAGALILGTDGKVLLTVNNPVNHYDTLSYVI